MSRTNKIDVTPAFLPMLSHEIWYHDMNNY